MSYDTSMCIDTGDGEAIVEDIGNYTYNVSAMFREAFVYPLSKLSGMKGEKLHDLVAQGVHDMQENPEKYRAMNPPNGWGDYEGALDYATKILRACERHPNATLRVG